MPNIKSAVSPAKQCNLPTKKYLRILIITLDLTPSLEGFLTPKQPYFEYDRNQKPTMITFCFKNKSPKEVTNS